MSEILHYHDIIIAGPAGDGFLIDIDGDGLEVVLSANADAYLVSELARVAPKFAGLPVYHKHADNDGPVRSRLLIGGVGRVGRIVESWWNAEERQIRATLGVTSELWRGEFLISEWRKKWGFSMNVRARARAIEGMGMSLLDQIPTLFSVDVVKGPAMGGRFVDSPPLNEEQLEAEWDFFERIREEKLRGRYE